MLSSSGFCSTIITFLGRCVWVLNHLKIKQIFFLPIVGIITSRVPLFTNCLVDWVLIVLKTLLCRTLFYKIEKILMKIKELFFRG